MYAYHSSGRSVAAVTLEALTAAGDRVEPRFRRTLGGKSGALFRVAIRPDPRLLVVCEGEVSALAAAIVHPCAEAVAAGGSSGMAAVGALVGPDWPSVLIEPDGDLRGEEAARRARDGIGGDVEVRWRADGDVADDLAATVRALASTDPHGLAGAWSVVLARTCASRRTHRRAPRG